MRSSYSRSRRGTGETGEIERGNEAWRADCVPHVVKLRRFFSEFLYFLILQNLVTNKNQVVITSVSTQSVRAIVRPLQSPAEQRVVPFNFHNYGFKS